MTAKHAFVILALMAATIGLSLADVPNLAGNWTGSFKGYDKSLGYMEVNKTGSLNMTISEQSGRLFTGNFSINFSLPQTGKMQQFEGFSGAIGLDNRTLYIAEYDKGYDIGTVLSNDNIELIYIEDGPGESAGAYLLSLNRIK
jgi:hypothetical protein